MQQIPPEALAAAIRNHWRIENGLHRVLDVGFREDASRVRDRNAARNLALLRKIALNLARADGTLKASLKGKRKSAGWERRRYGRPDRRLISCVGPGLAEVIRGVRFRDGEPVQAAEDQAAVA